MSQLGKWSVAGLFAAFLGWELLAAFDGSAGTWPLTQIITTYVPWPVTAAVVATLVVWLPAHFWIEYQRRAAARRERPPPP